MLFTTKKLERTGFAPFELKITLETLGEADILRCLAGYNISIPNVVDPGDRRGYHATIIELLKGVSNAINEELTEQQQQSTV